MADAIAELEMLADYEVADAAADSNEAAAVEGTIEGVETPSATEVDVE